jgi:hypothetical protein
MCTDQRLKAWLLTWRPLVWIIVDNNNAWPSRIFTCNSISPFRCSFPSKLNYFPGWFATSYRALKLQASRFGRQWLVTTWWQRGDNLPYSVWAFHEHHSPPLGIRLVSYWYSERRLPSVCAMRINPFSHCQLCANFNVISRLHQAITWPFLAWAVWTTSTVPLSAIRINEH